MRRLALGSQVYRLALRLGSSTLACSREGKRMLRPLVRLRGGEWGRNTTAGVRGGFAPWGVASLSTCFAEAAPSGQPARARGEDNAPFSAAQPFASLSTCSAKVVRFQRPTRKKKGGRNTTADVRGGFAPFPQHTRSQVYRLAQLRLSAFSVQPARKKGGAIRLRVY
ncbi:hypothetical protein SDC9_41145 [bioreactor metagenome]|uniref:Uncharacterized protein n=1 Tax=bioreactor metagenome TaxID=1076179 RepID=A0A644VWZ7_9ZZZZ